MQEGFNNLMNATGKVLETVPEAYQDIIQPAAKESGKTVALIPRAINAAFVPLRCWIAKAEYRLAETEKLLSIKLEHVSPDKIQTPEPYVAIPAIQAIAYSMDSEELRNMYANLLSKSMNTDTKELVHPAFVEIIKQMSPVDAKIFKIIVEHYTAPVADIVLNYPNNGGTKVIYRNLTWITELEHDVVSVSVDNLCRLGLLYTIPGNTYTNKENYNCILQSSEFLKAFNTIKSIYPNNEYSYEFGVLYKSELGNNFYDVCII